MQNETQNFTVTMSPMTLSDLWRVEQIENESFKMPWIDKDFRWAMKQQSIMIECAKVSPDGVPMIPSVEGFIVYDIRAATYRITNIAVAPVFRMAGIGGIMVQRIKNKIANRKNITIDAVVEERNVGAQLFFKALGFLCVSTAHDCFEDHTDGYLFRFHN